MSDKKYEFLLTEKQINMINELIEEKFELAIDMNATPMQGIELISLSSYLNFNLGFEKGVEQQLEIEE